MVVSLPGEAARRSLAAGSTHILLPALAGMRYDVPREHVVYYVGLRSYHTTAVCQLDRQGYAGQPL